MYLKEGDLIAIVSPSRAISRDALDPAIRWLEGVGFRVLLGEHAHAEHHQFAGTDAQRAADLQYAIDHKEVRAIWSSRGGYGGVRIVDRVDLTPLLKHPKWLMGYSDFTVFHSHVHGMGLPSIHCTMPINVAQADEQSLHSLRDAMTGQALHHPLPEHPLNRKGAVEGPLVGGNLSILYSLLGSASDLDTTGKILFLEDLDEYLYHVDRMMMNLKRNGKLNGLRALVVGGLTDMNDNTVPYGRSAEEIVREHVEEFDFPVYFGLRSGHLEPNLALRLGRQAVIEGNTLSLPP